MTISELKSELRIAPDDYWEVMEAELPLPETLAQFAEAWNNPALNSEGTFADNLADGAVQDGKPFFGAYTSITVDYDDYDKYFCDGCAPNEIRDTFPRALIAIEPQKSEEAAE